jgi:hypothetical protein
MKVKVPSVTLEIDFPGFFLKHTSSGSLRPAALEEQDIRTREIS